MTQKQFCISSVIVSITQNLTQMQNWLSNILDILEITSTIAIRGKYLCQGATDILINHITLMFKNFCILIENRPHKSPLWHQNISYLTHRRSNRSSLGKNGKLTLHFKKWIPIIELTNQVTQSEQGNTKPDLCMARACESRA